MLNNFQNSKLKYRKWRCHYKNKYKEIVTRFTLTRLQKESVAQHVLTKNKGLNKSLRRLKMLWNATTE